MPRLVIPDEVLEGISRVPDLWHAFIEMSRWAHDANTGSIEVLFGDGGAVDLLRKERLATGAKLARALDPSLQPICPICQQDLDMRDYGNKWECSPCDIVYTVWELRRRQSFRQKEPVPAHVR